MLIYSSGQVQNHLRDLGREGVKVEIGCSKYLAVLIGPSADAAMNYYMVMGKFKLMCYFWLKQNILGNFFHVYAYNTYCLPILNFVALFHRPPDNVLAEAQALADRFAHGPKDWIHGSVFVRSNVDLGLHCCRCAKSHLYSLFLKSGIKFMFDYNARINELQDRGFDPASPATDLGAVFSFQCIDNNPFSFRMGPSPGPVFKIC